MHLFPNPVADLLAITYYTAESQTAAFTIRSIYGESLSRVSHFASKGSNHLQLDVSDLENGIYLLVQNGKEARRLVIAR